MRFDKNIFINKVLGLFAVCLLLFSHAFAQSGGQYELSWSTIDGGIACPNEIMLRYLMGQGKFRKVVLSR